MGEIERDIIRDKNDGNERKRERERAREMLMRIEEKQKWAAITSDICAENA